MTRATACAPGPSQRFGIALAVAVLLAASGPAIAPPKAHASSCTLAGEGTETAPFLVEDADDLALVGVAPCGLAAHYRQTADIILPDGAPNHTPIGTGSAPFTGVYDGMSFRIETLRISAATSDDIGLFGRTDGATIRDIAVLGANVTGSFRVGILAGSAYRSTIERSNVSGTVSGVAFVGGLIGETTDAVRGTTVTASGAASVTVEGSGSNIGGLIGSADGLITDAFVAADRVTGGGASSSRVGGLVGQLTNGGVVDRSFAQITVEGPESVGGLVGQLLDGARITSSSAAGQVGSTSSGNNIGGLVGLAASGTRISGSVAFGVQEVRGASNVGGLVGQANGDVLIETSSAARDTSGDSSVGGLVGVLGALHGATPRIVASFATGRASGNGPGSFSIGGLVGSVSSGGEIVDSFARGEVSGGSILGGLVGNVAFADASIVNSFATGEITGGTPRGGLVGTTTGAGVSVTGTGSFWDRDTTGLTTSVGSGVSKATVEMKTLATFTDVATVGLDVPWAIVAGWAAYDPSGSPARIWGLCSAVNDGYPFLLSRYESDPCGGSGPSVDPDDPSGSDDPSDTGRTPSTGSTSGDDGTETNATMSGDAPVVGCAPLLLRVGVSVTCTIDSGPAHAEILWRATFNPTIASAGVLLDGDGRGTFEFTVPASAVGSEVQVELVEWARPLSLGAVEGPLPGAVPAGEGPGPTPRGQLLLTALLAATLLQRRRGSGAGWPGIRVSR